MRPSTEGKYAALAAHSGFVRFGGMSPPRRPCSLGPFDLLSPAARGATAVTWRAVHRSRRVPVAIKIITPPAPHRRDRMQRLFAHEVRSVARLDHPGIVRVHDFGTLPPSDDPRLPPLAPYLVMEWVSGGTLARSAGVVGWPALRQTLLALLDALAHAHARGVIHQDIKAANVLRSERGPVLSDFGIAFSVDHEAALESGPRFMGTPDYMAPEQILMQRRVIGPWSDLYALGCLAYEQVTGEPPFAERSQFEVLRAHLDAPIPRLPLRDGIPPAFADWVHRLLDKDPTRRYRFAADAARALASLPGGGAMPEVRGAPAATPDRLPLPGTGKALFALRETHLVGRAEQQATLYAALEGVVEANETRVVLVEGPSGVGKSRLSLWLAREAHAAGLADGMRATHAPDHATAPTAGDGLAPMLARHLRIGGLEGEGLVERLVERLGDLETAYGVAAAVAPDRRFSCGGRTVMLGSTREYDEAHSRALAHLCAERPMVVLLDDAQWAEDGLRWVEHLLAHHPNLPALVVASVCLDRVRPAIGARLERLRAHPMVSRLPVGPLREPELAAALRARLPLDDGLLWRLVQRAGGSPVFAEELVAHWLHTDALVERHGELALRATARGAVPRDLLAVWQARLADVLSPLGEGGRLALEAAASIGGTVKRRIWRHVASEVEPEVLTASRERLLDARLALGDADGGWRFAHPMVREVLVASARRSGRSATLHRRCAVVLMSDGADPSLVADHRLAAGDHTEAVGLLFDAVRRHRQRRDHLAMRRDLLRLTGALRRLRRPKDAPERIEVRVLWAEACQGVDDLSHAWRHVSRAARQATARDDPRLIGWARLTQAHLRLRERGAVEQWLLPAREAAARAHDPELSWSANYALTFVRVQRGEFDEAERDLTELVPLLAGQADEVKRGDLLRLMALIARGRGRFDEAEASAAQAVVRYARSGSRLKQSHGHNLVGDLARYQGRLEASADAYREAVRLSRLSGSYDVLTDELNLGLVLLEMGRHRDARRALTTVAQRAERIRFRVALVYANLCLLVCEAHDRRWSAYDIRWQRLRPIHDGKAVDLDIARVAEMAAREALDAREITRAAAALRLAADQYGRLGQRDRADATRARAEQIEAAV